MLGIVRNCPNTNMHHFQLKVECSFTKQRIVSCEGPSPGHYTPLLNSSPAAKIDCLAASVAVAATVMVNLRSVSSVCYVSHSGLGLGRYPAHWNNS